MRVALPGLMVLILSFTSPLAGAPTTGPLIADFGPVFNIPDASFPIDASRQQKVVFDLARSPEQGLNRSLESVARFMNMNARVGVPASKMDIVVVVHGRAVRNLLNNEGWAKRHEESNPNRGLVDALMAAGVRFYICGQSAGFMGVASEEFIDGTNMALSAMSVLTGLQADGYSLLP